MTPQQKGQRRARLIALCDGFPEVATDGEQHLNVRVRGRVFAYYLDDHHGDGMVVVSVKTLPAVQAMLIREEPSRFLPTPYMAHRGWVSVRIDGRSVDWDELAGLLADSYRLVAPKRLAALVTGV